MYDNYHYPMGADTPSAPWNREETPEMKFNILVSQTLSKTVGVTTDDYIPLIEQEEDTGVYEDYADTDETDWKKVLDNSEHYTPLELIELFKEYLKEFRQETKALNYHPSFIEHLISECESWVEDELEVIEE